MNYAPLVGATLLPNVGGIVSGYFMKDSIKNWYPTLKKPSWRPPNWAFGPVWTSLYCGMGYSSYLVFQHGGGFKGAAALPLASFATNLAINWAWSPIFFNLKKLDWSLYTIILLDISTVTTGYLFYKINKLAGYLFIPYGLWLGLATALTYRIYKDNPKAITEKGETKDN